MSAVEWVDAPPPGRVGGGDGPGSVRWAERLAPLVDRPGQWAIVLRTATAAKAYISATHLRRGTLTAPPGRWEFTARKTDTGGAVYARYLGANKGKAL